MSRTKKRKIHWKTKPKVKPHKLHVKKSALNFINQIETHTTKKSKRVKLKKYVVDPKTYITKISKALMKSPRYKQQAKRLSDLFYRSYKNFLKRDFGLSSVIGAGSKFQRIILKLAQDKIAKNLLNQKKNKSKNFLKLDLRNTRDPLIRSIREYGTLLSYLEAINSNIPNTTIRYNGKYINRNGIILNVFQIIRNGESKLIYASDGSLYQTLDDILWEKSGEIKI